MKNPFEGIGDKLSKSAKIVTLGLGLTAASHGVEAKSMAMPSPEDATEISIEKGDTGWAAAAVAEAKKDYAALKTADDARWFLVDCRKVFLDHVGMLAVESESQAKYSREDYVALLEYANQMKAIMQKTVLKFGSQNAELQAILTDYDYVIQHLTNRSSYAGSKQAEAIDNYLQNN